MSQHMDGMAGPAGTFEGHLLPGLLLVGWAVVWAVRELRDRRPADAPIEAGAVVPTLKIVTLFVAGWFEMPNSGWYPADYAMGWHHITIYMGYALSGAVDLLHRRGHFSARATYVAFGGASLNTALLFYAHGNPGGVESTAHLLFAAGSATTGLLAILEGVFVVRWLRWIRIGSMLGLGAWFSVIGWLLFVSGWDLVDPVRVSWVFTLFSWTYMAATGVVLLLIVVGSSRSQAAEDAR